MAGSNRTQLLPALCSLEGGKMGGEGSHEQHSSSVPGLHGGCLPVTDTGIHIQQASHWEVWVWQGVLSQVEAGDRLS